MKNTLDNNDLINLLGWLNLAAMSPNDTSIPLDMRIHYIEKCREVICKGLGYEYSILNPPKSDDE